MMGQATCLVSTRRAAAIIQHDYPKAMYVHFVSHVLNLCVVAAGCIQAIWNMYGVVEEICLFFNYSPKRQQQATRAY